MHQQNKVRKTVRLEEDDGVLFQKNGDVDKRSQQRNADPHSEKLEDAITQNIGGDGDGNKALRENFLKTCDHFFFNPFSCFLSRIRRLQRIKIMKSHGNLAIHLLKCYACGKGM